MSEKTIRTDAKFAAGVKFVRHASFTDVPHEAVGVHHGNRVFPVLAELEKVVSSRDVDLR